jgi:hypothetical protein
MLSQTGFDVVVGRGARPCGERFLKTRPGLAVPV